MNAKQSTYSSADLRSSPRLRELVAIHYLTHLGEVARALVERRFAELACFAEYLTRDVPKALAQTDPALYRTLRRAVTEAHVAGYGNMDARLLWAMSGQGAEASRGVEPGSEDEARCKWHWVRRNPTGVVEAAVSDPDCGPGVLQLAVDLRAMAAEGPIERVLVRDVVIGTPLVR